MDLTTLILILLAIPLAPFVVPLYFIYNWLFPGTYPR